MTETTKPVEVDQFAWVRKLLPRIVVGALIAAALVGVYAVVIGRWDDTCSHLLGTIALLVFFSLASWYDADVSARRAPWFGAVSVVLSGFLLLDGLVKIWAPSMSADQGATDPYLPYADQYPGLSAWGFGAWIALVIVARLGLLHIHLVLNTQRKFTGPVMGKVTVGTLILVGALTLGLSAPLVFDHASFDEPYWRFIGAIAILDTLGTILIPLTYALFTPKDEEASNVGRSDQPATSGAAVSPQTVVASPEAIHSAPAPVTPSAAVGPYPNAQEPGTGYRLEWPRYVNGVPLPMGSDGTPDFTGVIGY